MFNHNNKKKEFSLLFEKEVNDKNIKFYDYHLFPSLHKHKLNFLNLSDNMVRISSDLNDLMYDIIEK